MPLRGEGCYGVGGASRDSAVFGAMEEAEEAVPGPSVFPSGEPGVSGDFWVYRGAQGLWSRPLGGLKMTKWTGKKAEH